MARLARPRLIFRRIFIAIAANPVLVLFKNYARDGQEDSTQGRPQAATSSITRTSILAMWLVGMSPRAVRSGDAK